MREILVKPSSLLETFLRNPVPRFPTFFGLCLQVVLQAVIEVVLEVVLEVILEVILEDVLELVFKDVLEVVLDGPFAVCP